MAKFEKIEASELIEEHVPPVSTQNLLIVLHVSMEHREIYVL